MASQLLLTPPLAFLLYIVLAGLLSLSGRLLAGPSEASSVKSSTYSSGEAAPTRPAAPGYKQFFVIALFFAILHLGVLVMATGAFTLITAIYLVGLLLALLALILG